MNLTGSMCWGTSTLTLRYDFQHSCFFLSHILLFQVGKKFIWSNCIHSKGYKPQGQHELYSIPGYDLYNVAFGICDKLNRYFLFFFIFINNILVLTDIHMKELMSSQPIVFCWQRNCLILLFIKVKE